MSNIFSVNPFRCKMWHLHDRLEHLIVEDTCRAEINSFAKHGQLVAALGRPVRADPDNDVELICGARRLFVARHLNVQLLVEVREMTDRAAVIARDIENKQRQDVSPYERGLIFDVVVNAVPNPQEIREGWGPDLAAALHDIKKRRPSPARESSRPSCRALRLSKFINNWSPHRFQAGRVRTRHHDEVIMNFDGTPLFRIRAQEKAIAVLLPRDNISEETLEAARDAVRDVLRQRRRSELAAGVFNTDIDSRAFHQRAGDGAMNAGA